MDYMDTIKKLTVPVLKEIAERMGAVVTSRTRKGELIEKIDALMMDDWDEALVENELYAVRNPSEGMTRMEKAYDFMSGAESRITKRIMAFYRVNKTPRLTPKQERRIMKKIHRARNHRDLILAGKA